MVKVTVYIDESGTLPDPKDSVVVVAAVWVESPATIDLLLKTIKKKTLLKRPTGELKFYTAGDQTKYLFFKQLVKLNVSVCVLVVEKSGRKIPDTPEHYGALCLLLLEDVIRFTSDIREIVFDCHFSRESDREIFNRIIIPVVGTYVPICHVKSIEDKRVNIADMVAGATLAKETGENPKWYDLIHHKVVSSRKVSWKEVKKRLIDKKNLLEPV